MFSVEEKKLIAKAVEDAILILDHPEMPKEKPNFKLHIDGKESWSFADIEPNWTYENKTPSINPWNERQAKGVHVPEEDKEGIMDHFHNTIGKNNGKEKI